MWLLNISYYILLYHFPDCDPKLTQNNRGLARPSQTPRRCPNWVSLEHSSNAKADHRSDPLTLLRIRWGDTPTSPNKGDGCPFRPLILFVIIL